MEFNKKDIQKITYDYLIKHTDVKEEYEKIQNAIIDKAKHGANNCLFHISDVKSVKIFYAILKLLQIDGFNITEYLTDDQTTFVNIGWEK